MILRLLFVLACSYFIGEHVSFDISLLVVVPAIMYIIVEQLQKRFSMQIFWLLYAVILVINSSDLLRGARILLNEGIHALNHFNIILPLQQTTGTDATLITSLLVVTITALLNEKTVYVFIGFSMIALFILDIPLHIMSFTLFMGISILLIAFYHQRTVVPIHFVTIIVICGLCWPLQHLPIINNAGHELMTWKNAVQYDADTQTELTRGHLQAIQPFTKTETPAFRIAMEQPQAMYLKSFVGVSYDNGWSTVNEDATSQIDITQHLQDNDYFAETQYTKASESDEKIVSIEPLSLNKNDALIPYELASTVEQFTPNNTKWQSTKLFGTSHYTYKVGTQSINDYPLVASALYAAPQENYLHLEALTNYLSYTSFTAIPQDVKTLLRNHFESDSTKKETYEQIIDTVKEQVSTIKYNETPSTTNGEFLPFLLEQSKEGYSVHYATLATLLFRNYGVPARYVEGYLITNDDVKDAKPFSELSITSDSRHAWPEIYVDFIGWVPVEVTPGYAKKMPTVAKTTFEQPISNNTAETANVDETTSEVKDEPLPNTPDNENSSHISIWPSLLATMLLVVSAYFIWRKRYNPNRAQVHFTRFIRHSRKKLKKKNGAIHEIIYALNIPEANAAYKLYNEMQYSSAPYSKQKLQQLKQLLKSAKKKMN